MRKPGSIGKSRKGDLIHPMIRKHIEVYSTPPQSSAMPEITGTRINPKGVPIGRVLPKEVAKARARENRNSKDDE
jgi:hypothetical protein